MRQTPNAKRWMIRLLLVTALVSAGYPATTAVAQDDYKYDARGFSANRDTFNQFPCEHIDPLTGNLLLTSTDLKLPGNAGLAARARH